MAGFNGSGTFVRTYNWVTDKGNSVKVTASRMDGEDDGFATGLSACLLKDGQQTATAVIPFAQGHRSSDGSVGTPAQSWISDTDSGFYRIGANNVGLALAGVKAWDFATATTSVAASLAIGGTLAVTGAVDFTATASAAVISGGSHIGASANFTATCQAVTLVASGLVSGASANFTNTCSAAMFVATGAINGASANFTSTCSAASFHATGLVSGASANFSASCSAGTLVGTNLTISGGTVSLPAGSVAAAAIAAIATIATPQATTSGTTIDFTSIPSTVRVIIISFAGVSTSGTSNLLVQIGDSGGIEATSYVAGANSGATFASSTAGFIVNANEQAADVLSGQIILTMVNSSTNLWTSMGNLSNGGSTVWTSGGHKATSAALDRVRITATNGSDTFDAGSINIAYF